MKKRYDRVVSPGEVLVCDGDTSHDHNTAFVIARNAEYTTLAWFRGGALLEIDTVHNYAVSFWLEDDVCRVLRCDG